MSNNKQSMKLYTEEEIRRLLKERIIFDDDDLEELTPIELPSDEEMIPLKNVFEFTEWMSSLINSNYKSGGNWYHNKKIYTTEELYAKWMRDKIQGGNNV